MFIAGYRHVALVELFDIDSRLCSVWKANSLLQVVVVDSLQYTKGTAYCRLLIAWQHTANIVPSSCSIEKNAFCSVTRNYRPCSRFDLLSSSVQIVAKFCKYEVRCIELQIWIYAAQFEIRQQRLDAARKILGMAIGLCPKDKLFNFYIDLEYQLGNFDRCRTLYGKYLEWRPENCRAWCRWLDLEQSLGEINRCRSMYELATAQPVLDMPEVLWKVRLTR